MTFRFTWYKLTASIAQSIHFEWSIALAVCSNKINTNHSQQFYTAFCRRLKSLLCWSILHGRWLCTGFSHVGNSCLIIQLQCCYWYQQYQLDLPIRDGNVSQTGEFDMDTAKQVFWGGSKPLVVPWASLLSCAPIWDRLSLRPHVRCRKRFIRFTVIP